MKKIFKLAEKFKFVLLAKNSDPFRRSFKLEVQDFIFSLLKPNIIKEIETYGKKVNYNWRDSIFVAPFMDHDPPTAMINIFISPHHFTDGPNQDTIINKIKQFIINNYVPEIKTEDIDIRFVS